MAQKGLDSRSTALSKDKKCGSGPKDFFYGDNPHLFKTLWNRTLIMLAIFSLGIKI